jgi:hypothetical protein
MLRGLYTVKFADPGEIDEVGPVRGWRMESTLV